MLRYFINSSNSNNSGTNGVSGTVMPTVNVIPDNTHILNTPNPNVSNNGIPVSPVRWAHIPGFPYHIISTDGRVINTGRTCGKKNHPAGRELKKVIGGNQEYVTLCCKGEKPFRVAVSKLMIMAFKIANPNVKEKKIIPNTKKDIRREKTRMIIEKIDKMKPASLDNLQFNFWWRGENHWNHKLDNDRVELIRSKIDMTFKDFVEQYGDEFIDVSLKTVQEVFKGNSWRVRTKPISPMTYPTENYPDGRLIDLIKEDEIDWV